ncbi:MAG: hypothetical protein F4169_04630 [Gammaproteobacteria bacterium]|nr:hypothetical protein [Rhodothermaceae bacterium]MYF28140.1 hypothetical protein [Gammaproteobacteria bacterium]
MSDIPFLVQVIPALDPADIEVKAAGSAVEWASAGDVSPWRFDDGYWRGLRLVNWINAHGYNAPSEPKATSCFQSDSFLRGERMVLLDPEVDGDGYGHYGNPDSARVKVTALEAKIVSLTRQPTIIDSAVWDNRTEENPHDFSATVNTEVEESVESHWDVTHGISTNEDVKVGVGPVDAEGSVEYSTTWGEGGSHSTTKSVSTSDTISGSVEPGKMQLAALVAQRGVLTIEVTYRFEILDGWMRGGFYRKIHGGLHDGNPVTGKPGSGIDAKNCAAPIVDLIEWVWGRGANAKVQTQHLVCDFFADADLSAHPLTENTAEAISDAIGGTDLVQVYP